MTIPTWLQSSQNPKKYSLTIISIGGTLVAFLPLLAMLGIPISEIDLNAMVNALATGSENIVMLINQVGIVFGSGAALWGLLRKLKPRG